MSVSGFTFLLVFPLWFQLILQETLAVFLSLLIYNPRWIVVLSPQCTQAITGAQTNLYEMFHDYEYLYKHTNSCIMQIVRGGAETWTCVIRTHTQFAASVSQSSREKSIKALDDDLFELCNINSCTVCSWSRHAVSCCVPCIFNREHAIL